MNAMEETIYKYELHFEGSIGPHHLSLPQGAKFLSAQNQHGRLMLWFRVNIDNPDVDYQFYLLETGKVWPSRHKYLATIQLHEGHYVLHLLEKVK